MVCIHKMSYNNSCEYLYKTVLQLPNFCLAIIFKYLLLIWSVPQICEVYYYWYLLWWCKAAAASVLSFTSIIIYPFVHNLQTFFCDNITWALVIVEYFVSGILYTMYCFATVGQNLPTLITLNELHFIICNSFFCRQLCICILMQQYGLSALHALLLFLS